MTESIPSTFWDERYANHPGHVYGEQPNAWLVEHRSLLHPGMRALAIADGDGRNGVWLAEQGLSVHSVDQSAAGLKKAGELARSRGVKLETECADLATWNWPHESYDVVIAIFAHFGPHLRRQIHRQVIQTLKPGGIVLLNAFNPDQHNYTSGGPENAALLFSEADLREDFDGLIIDVLHEYEGHLEEGDVHRGPGALLGMVARKPVP